MVYIQGVVLRIQF